jgi:hypothetical protein
MRWIYNFAMVGAAEREEGWRRRASSREKQSGWREQRERAVERGRTVAGHGARRRGAE